MIVCSVSTIPDRTSDFIQVLDELLVSTILPDFLYVSISKYYPRLGKSHSEEDLKRISDKLENYPIPNRIIFYDKDIGPCVKLITPLENHELKNDDVIIIMDDDNGLFATAIECLMIGYNLDKNAVYGIMGTITNGTNTNFVHGEYIESGFCAVHLLGGYRGVLYPVSLIPHKSIMNWVNHFIDSYDQYGMIPDHDDSIFSAYLDHHKIESRVVSVFPKDKLNYWPKSNSNGIFQDSKLNQSLSIFHKSLELIK